ncbi:MAG: hypothetical protein GXP56_12630 [Deltaproteobacteria bacterium]|nr:hypothetical protein [Deltaproteobacteria bacterium]
MAKNRNWQLIPSTGKGSVWPIKNGLPKILITGKTIAKEIPKKPIETGFYRESGTTKSNRPRPFVLQRWTRGHGKNSVLQVFENQ